jgi:hypothetical protein
MYVPRYIGVSQTLRECQGEAYFLGGRVGKVIKSKQSTDVPR